jgi:hypothetical protein
LQLQPPPFSSPPPPSLAYIPMNSPFLDAKGWDAEVTKMIKAYGAPIDDADAKAIAEYLSKNYSP